MMELFLITVCPSKKVWLIPNNSKFKTFESGMFYMSF